MWAGLAQSEQRLATGWTALGSNPTDGEISRTRPHRPPTKWVTDLLPRLKRQGCGVDHPPRLAPRLKKEQSYTSTAPLGLHGLLQGELHFYLSFKCNSELFVYVTQNGRNGTVITMLSNCHTICLEIIYTFMRVTQGMNPGMGGVIQRRRSVRSYKQIPTKKAVHNRSCTRTVHIFRIFSNSHEICCRF